MNLTALSFAGAVTDTSNEHEAVRLVASVAVHATVVVPMSKALPDPGAHATETGGDPFCVVGMTKVTSAECPFVDDAVRFPGHEMVGASGVGVGWLGEPPHATAVARRTRAAVCRSATPGLATRIEMDRACLCRASCPSMLGSNAKAEL
jgi:hypothetical protein